MTSSGTWAYCLASRCATAARHHGKKAGSDSACSHSIHEALDEGTLQTSSIRNDNNSTAPSTIATEVASGCPKYDPTTVAVPSAETATCGTASPLRNPSTTALPNLTANVAGGSTSSTSRDQSRVGAVLLRCAKSGHARSLNF